ncbi:MAG: VTT domain-containing protein [Candidatus Aenigmarchaeota archaeon]|nr:VTT domain-containing protein [Candidatus Aenigmarchaeota archaeon]
MFEILAGFGAWATGLIQTWGYAGVFIVAMLGSASIFFPVIPSVLIIPATAVFLNPMLVGVAAGAGAALGELTGYFAGEAGRRLVRDRYSGLVDKTEAWSKKYGIFMVIILFAALPLPADIVGILAGMAKYDVKKFVLANFIGKSIKFTAIAVAGAYGISWLQSMFGLI